MRIKGIKRVTVRKPGGKLYVYYRHRKTGVVIKAEFGTAHFLSEVERLNGMERPAPLPGTLGLLFQKWHKAPEFTNLKPRTRLDYEKIIEYLAPISAMPLRDLDTPAVLSIRDQAFKAKKRRFANYVVRVISSALSWGVPRGIVQVNLARGCPLVERPKDMPKGNARWAPGTPRAFIASKAGAVRWAAAIAYHTGMRQGDMLTLPLSAWNEHEWLRWRQGKTGKVCEAYVSEELASELRTAREHALKSNSVLFINGSRGRPLTAHGFRALWGKANPLGTFHGLRATFAAERKEQGWTEESIQAALGHGDRASQRTYTEEVAARSLISGEIVRLRYEAKQQGPRRLLTPDGPVPTCGGVYFILGVETARVKIGFSQNNIAVRLQTVMAGSPEPLVFLGAIEGGTRRIESQLHKEFVSLRTAGEWFTATGELLAYIRQVCRPAEREQNGIADKPVLSLDNSNGRIR